MSPHCSNWLRPILMPSCSGGRDSTWDVTIKKYGALAGIHPSKAHYHVLKHSICVLLWQETHDLNAIQDHVGHRSSSSTLVYLRADAAQKAQTIIAGMSFGGAL